MAGESETAGKLEELVATIRSYDDPRLAVGEWKQAYRLLQKTELPPGRVTGVVGMRDVAGLAALAEKATRPFLLARAPSGKRARGSRAAGRASGQWFGGTCGHAIPKG